MDLYLSSIVLLLNPSLLFYRSWDCDLLEVRIKGVIWAARLLYIYCWQWCSYAILPLSQNRKTLGNIYTPEVCSWASPITHFSVTLG